MLEQKKIPIAEVFTSIQGEGRQSGMKMTFFRLAGCTVGKAATPETTSLLPILPTGKQAFMCTTYDGRQFPCDTDFHKYESYTVDELFAQVPEGVEWISITGGEPLMHMEHVVSIVAEAAHRGLGVHFETSGTIQLSETVLDDIRYHLVCSPKANYLPAMIYMADEIRLMVDPNFDIPATLEMLSHGQQGQVWLSPLSMSDDTTKIDRASMDKCLELMEMPEFYGARISLQIHKTLNVR